jgi:hypothetical protein
VGERGGDESILMKWQNVFYVFTAAERLGACACWKMYSWRSGTPINNKSTAFDLDYNILSQKKRKHVNKLKKIIIIKNKK